jgi:erythronate-4-phosphate dehydrogenase
MPLVDETFGQFGEIHRKAGRQFSPEDVSKADIVLVRSVTKVNEELLKDHRPQFVGTATIGTDHLDMDFMDQQGIHHSSAPGCNADSVAEYVVSCIAKLIHQGHLQQGQIKAGILGAGNVGSRVAERLTWLNIPHIVSDPPRAEREPAFSSHDLKDFKNCQLICLHAPLTTEGDHPTQHLIDEEFLSELSDDTVIISAGRGPVIKFTDLSAHMDRLICCLDVWEPEPLVSLSHLKKSHIASPHVAGYSIQSKWRGTTMLYETYCKHRGIKPKLPASPLPTPIIELQSQTWHEAILECYDPERDTLDMIERLSPMPESSSEISNGFDSMRKHYPLRHEFNFPNFTAPNLNGSDRRILEQLGLRIS